jgi:hypothetical protein
VKLADARDDARGEHHLVQRARERRRLLGVEPGRAGAGEARAQAAQQVGGGADRLVELVRQRGRHLAHRDDARREQKLLAVVELALHRAALLAAIGQAQSDVAAGDRGDLGRPLLRVAHGKLLRRGRVRVAPARCIQPGQRRFERGERRAGGHRRQQAVPGRARPAHDTRGRIDQRNASPNAARAVHTRPTGGRRGRAAFAEQRVHHEASSCAGAHAGQRQGADDDMHAPLRAQRVPEALHGVDAHAHVAPAHRAGQHRAELHLAGHVRGGLARRAPQATSWRPRRGWCSLTTRAWHHWPRAAARPLQPRIDSQALQRERRLRIAAVDPRGHSTKAQAGPAGSMPCGQASTTQRPRCHCSAAASSACGGMRAASASRSDRVSVSHQSSDGASSTSVASPRWAVPRSRRRIGGRLVLARSSASRRTGVRPGRRRRDPARAAPARRPDGRSAIPRRLPPAGRSASPA